MMNVSSSDAVSKLEAAKEFYKADKLLQASRILNGIQLYIKTTLESEASSPAEAAAAEEISEALKQPPLPRILSECNEVHALRTSLRSQEDWILSYNGTETKVWYRREQATSSHTIRIEGQIRAPLLNVAALIYEVDLYESLFWYVTSAEMLPANDKDTSSLLRRGAHIQVYAPWPLYKRDVAVYGFLTDGLDEDDCVIVVSRSIKPTDPVDTPPPPSSRIVRVDMHRSGFELTPAGPGLTKASFLYNVDPHLSFMPMALINWGARTLCRWSLRVLESRARDLEKVSRLYITRLNNDPVYSHIRGRLSDYWAAKGHTEEAVAAAENRRVSISSQRSDNFDPDEIPDGPPPSLIRQLLQNRADGHSGKRRGLSSYLLGS